MSSYGYNPLTSKLDRTGNGGGGGGNVTITTDDGNSRAATTFDLFGQNAGTVPIVDTATIAGDTIIENMAWETQYIVDPTATVGLRGTFQTIQAALNQAVADGMALNTPRKIIIRARAITENLTIPTGAILEGACYSFPAGGVFTPIQPAITGNHTFADNAIISLTNLSFVAAATNVDLFQCATGGGFYTNNCNFAVASGVGMFVNILAGNAFVSASDCTFLGLNGEYGIAVSNSGSKVVLRNCDFPGNAKVTVDESVIFLYSCTNIGGCASTNAGELHAFNTQFAKNSASGLPHITGNFNVVNLSKCSFQGTTDYCISNSPADIYFDSCTILSDGAISAIPRFCEAGANVHMNADTQGNLLVTALTATNYQVTGSNHYIGVTSTAAPRTITLPLVADCYVDQVFIIKDESLAAATNNITVSGNGALIDGAANYVINTNGGYVALKFNGTAFYIINNVITSSAGIILNGDTGSATGSTLTVFANQALKKSGSTVFFENSGTTSTLNLADPINGNLLLGLNAGNLTASGPLNTCLGNSSFEALTTGTGNNSFGNFSSYNITSGNDNVAIGSFALSSCQSGISNTVVGNSAMGSGLGSNNSILGSLSGITYTSTESNNVIISNPGVVADNDTIRIGHTQTRNFQAGISGVAVASSLPVVIDSNGQLGTKNIGEQVISFINQASGGALVNNTAKNVTSISLTAGTWDLTALGGFQASGGSVTGTRSTVSISAVSATRGTIGDNEASVPLVAVVGGDLNITVPAYRVVIGSTTTFYLVSYATFTVGTYNAYGRISAVRIA